MSAFELQRAAQSPILFVAVTAFIVPAFLTFVLAAVLTFLLASIVALLSLAIRLRRWPFNGCCTFLPRRPRFARLSLRLRLLPLAWCLVLHLRPRPGGFRRRRRLARPCIAPAVRILIPTGRIGLPFGCNWRT